jgi:hemerythrin-like domain-containing protein
MANSPREGLQAFFTQDHREIDALWADVERAVDADDPAPAERAFVAFDRALRRHIEMEETVLFRAFEQATGMTGGGPTFVMRQEHRQMHGLLDGMAAAVKARQPDRLLEGGDTLLMLIQQHNVKEEGMLYPMAEQHLEDWAPLAATLERMLG